MAKFNEISASKPIENPGETGGETSVDTQAEVDLLCGGVGFDDGPAEGAKWQEWRNKQKSGKDKEA